jgi:hypothetical protein
MYDYMRFFCGVSSGASWRIGGILYIRNKILRSRFGGYTAHHQIGGARSVRRAQSEMLNKRMKIAIAVQQ